jgi:acyl carrier protein
MSYNAIMDDLRQYVRDNFLYMRSDLAFRDEDSLLARGIIDSLGVMELVGFVEEHWGLVVSPDEITAEHFGTLGSVARFVASRAGAQKAATSAN